MSKDAVDLAFLKSFTLETLEDYENFFRITTSNYAYDMVLNEKLEVYEGVA